MIFTVDDYSEQQYLEAEEDMRFLDSNAPDPELSRKVQEEYAAQQRAYREALEGVESGFVVESSEDEVWRTINGNRVLINRKTGEVVKGPKGLKGKDLDGKEKDKKKQQETHDATGLPLNDDGTVTLYHGTTESGEKAIRKEGGLRGKEDGVFLTTSKEDLNYGDRILSVRVDPDLLELDDEFPDGRKDFRIPARVGALVKMKIEG